jgi:hypothetical protein
MVYDKNGKGAGRIEEIRAEPKGRKHVVTEYLIGRRALLERLSIPGLSLTFLSFLGARGHHATHRVPWDKLDLADPRHPRLTCTVDDLPTL